MTNRKYSIIIPTYNRAYILWKALLSVTKQTYYNWEAIIVDDGSTDDTYKQVKEFKEVRFKYIYQNNSGPCVARNVALEKAEGEFICYLDSDDEFREDYLYYINEHLSFNQLVKFGICNQNVRWELYDKSYNIISYAQESSSFGDDVKLDHLVKRTKRFNCGGLFHINSPKITWEPKVKHMHDWELLLRLASMFPKGFHYIPLSLYKYYSRYGKDGRCANVTYRDWQNCYKTIWKLHKKSFVRPSDDWFKNKIKKYDLLISKSHGKDVKHRINKIFTNT